MTDPGRDSAGLMAELKRRHVFRVFAVYCAVAFLLLQVMDLVVPALLLPDWTYRLLAVVLALGLPVALILTWAFEMRPDGVRRTGMPLGSPADSAATGPSTRALTAPIAVLLLVAAGWWLGQQGNSTRDPVGASAQTAGDPDGSGTTHEERVSIAVLPFVNMSSDPEQDFFSDGISEELLNLLAKMQALRVTARTSSFALREADLTAVEVGDTLNVSYVIEGSVRRDGAVVRVTAQLIETANGSHLWSETWDRRLDDIFAVQDEIAADVAEQLHVTLLGGLPAAEVTDPGAYGLVLRARHLVEEGTPAALREAEGLYRRALEIDPDYAAGWSDLGRLYVSAAYLTTQTTFEASFARAREAAQRSLAIDPDQAAAHAVLGALAESRGDLASAAQHTRQALELDPGDARTIGRAARLLAILGRVDEVVDLLENVIRQDPLNQAAYGGLSRAYLLLGRAADAVSASRTGVGLNPEAPGAWASLAVSYLYDGSPEQGLQAAQRESLEIWRLLSLAQAHHALGNARESDAMLAEVIRDYEQGWSYNIAYVTAYRGDVDGAFEWLDRALAYDDPGVSEVLMQPQFVVLHDDPRWPAFLDRIGKSPEDLSAIDFDVTLPNG